MTRHIICLSSYTLDGVQVYQVMRAGLPLIPPTEDKELAEDLWNIVWGSATHGIRTTWNGDTGVELELETK